MSFVDNCYLSAEKISQSMKKIGDATGNSKDT